jgi:N-methylhydantoinase A
MRFRFQINVLSVPIPDGPLNVAGIQTLVTRFIETYEQRFGKESAFVAAGIELTTYRAVARAHTALTELENNAPRHSQHIEPPGKRNVYSRGRWRPAAILRPEHLAADTRIDGLAVVEMPDTTIVIGEGQWAEVDAQSNLIIHLNA